ncbi:unnamed protein product [Durusdinium trenchii]|uniref:J domain-containing protein n=1 Tax=Durusdinium trenchii TaxID=1381693 RepID=A0ABP0I4W8_9DINO
MLFRLPGESRSYLCAKSASISVADPTIEVGQPVRFWMHLTSFTANHLQKPKEEGRAAAQLLATSTSTNSTGCMGQSLLTVSRGTREEAQLVTPLHGGFTDGTCVDMRAEPVQAKERPKPRNDYLDCYTGPKVKWEDWCLDEWSDLTRCCSPICASTDTGLYKALVKSQDIEDVAPVKHSPKRLDLEVVGEKEELTKIRNLIRKRTDPGYDPNDEEDFKVAPVRKFDSKADYYKLLEVDDFASVKDIKGAYKKLALQYHPDKNRDKKPDKLREMQDEFEKIQEAYEILSDRATRRQYDRARFDEARAKSQGMNSSFYSQKTNTDGNFWGRWSVPEDTADAIYKMLWTKKAEDLKALCLHLGILEDHEGHLKFMAPQYRACLGNFCAVLCKENAGTHCTCWYFRRRGHCPHQCFVELKEGVAKFKINLPVPKHHEAFELRRKQRKRGSSASPSPAPKRQPLGDEAEVHCHRFNQNALQQSSCAFVALTVVREFLESSDWSTKSLESDDLVVEALPEGAASVVLGCKLNTLPAQCLGFTRTWRTDLSAATLSHSPDDLLRLMCAEGLYDPKSSALVFQFESWALHTSSSLCPCAVHVAAAKHRDESQEKLEDIAEWFEEAREFFEVEDQAAHLMELDRRKAVDIREEAKEADRRLRKAKAAVWLAAKAKATKLPKAADLRLEVKISLEKALRGGLKIREVKRDRMQRAFGGTSQTLKTVNIKIDPGQADGSEYRLPGDGHWPSFNVSPGDLVVVFRHKAWTVTVSVRAGRVTTGRRLSVLRLAESLLRPDFGPNWLFQAILCPEVHPFLRQVAATAGSAASGALQLASPLQVRAKATQAAVAVWSPTFKGSMVLIRFKNPLLDLAPSKSCNVTFVLEGEGLPLPDTPMKRGPLAITVHVQLDGPALVPSINSSCCKDVLLRRHVKKYNHQGTLRVTLSNPLASGLPVRKYMALDARERAGLKVRLPCVAVVWTSPVGTDPVSFNKAAAALGFHAQGDPQAYAWCCHPRLFPQPLPCSSHVSLDDAELHSDDEVIDLPEGKPEPPAASKPVPKALTEEQEFLLRFELGPPGGFDTNAQSDDVRAGEASPHAGPAGQHTAEELTRLIREKQGDLEQVKRHWTERKERLSGERQEEDPVKNARGKRELDRVEREMNGLRSNFEFQLQAEKKWVDEFMQTHNYQNQWVCVFKPAMVVRTKPTEDGPISRRLVFDEVVKAKSWKARRTEGPTGWEAPPALTWHKTHGQLLQRWFNAEQQRFNDLQAKIEERRKVRNETFVAYRRKKKEVEEWSIPPGPSEEEKCEIEDEECEQLHFLMEPILKELKLHKRRLRELRQKRAEALLERQRKLDGGLSNAPLPVGFEASVEAAEAKGRRSCWQVEGP